MTANGDFVVLQRTFVVLDARKTRKVVVVVMPRKFVILVLIALTLSHS